MFPSFWPLDAEAVILGRCARHMVELPPGILPSFAHDTYAKIHSNLRAMLFFYAPNPRRN